jgi:hypothetical protein
MRYYFIVSVLCTIMVAGLACGQTQSTAIPTPETPATSTTALSPTARIVHTPTPTPEPPSTIPAAVQLSPATPTLVPAQVSTATPLPSPTPTPSPAPTSTPPPTATPLPTQPLTSTPVPTPTSTPIVPLISTIQNRGASGDFITIIGSGFPPGSTIESLSVGGVPASVNSNQRGTAPGTASDGVVVAVFTVPQSAPLGFQRLELVVGGVIADEIFEVTKPAPVPTPAPTPIATPITPPTAIYGPVNGSIQHDPEKKTVKTFVSPFIPSPDLIIEATFFNPHSPARAGWSYGFIFRIQDSGDFHQVTLHAGGFWNHVVRSAAGGEVDESTFQLRTQFNNTVDGSNHLRLVVVGDFAWRYINDGLAGKLDLVGHDAPSVVVVVTGVIEKEELDGSATRYEDFTIWEWDPVLAPLPE